MDDGILNINKPTGWTSHDVVGFIRRRLGVRRVGHAGTLDPFATGVLLVCVGQATRVAEYLMASDKTYRATAQLGVVTDTYDVDGAIQARAPIPDLDEDALRRALAAFAGEIAQIPPAYSAIKQQGVPAHQRARRGEKVELAARTVRVHEVRFIAWNTPQLVFEVTCEAGTYIRSIAHDLGARLGCGAMLTGLTRTRSGPFRLEQSVAPAALGDAAAVRAYMCPVREALYDLTPTAVSESEIARLVQGQAIAATEPPPTPMGYALGPDEHVLAILRYDAENRLWRPAKVFTSQSEG